MAEEDLHVTLAFLDEQPEDRLGDLHAAPKARRLPAAGPVYETLASYPLRAA